MIINSRIVNTIPDVTSFMYDVNKENQQEIINFMVEYTHLLHITLFIHSNYRKLLFNHLKSHYKLKKMTCMRIRMY